MPFHPTLPGKHPTRAPSNPIGDILGSLGKAAIPGIAIASLFDDSRKTKKRSRDALMALMLAKGFSRREPPSNPVETTKEPSLGRLGGFNNIPDIVSFLDQGVR